MTVIICIAGAVVGLIVAVVSNWLVLPMVLQAQERQWRDRLPFPEALLGDARRVRALTIAIYRYVMPVTFAAVGAAAAYYLFIAAAP
jgi:predicted RND superfamily exporter protein